MRRFQHFFSQWLNWLGFLIVSFYILVAVAAPLLSPMDPKDPGPFKRVGRITDRTPHPPSEKAILGTLPAQVDVYHALIWGTRDAVQFGILVAGGAFIFGVLYGSLAGYAGGFVNSFMMRVADAFLTFPVIAGVVFLQEIVAVTIESMGGTYWFSNEYYGRVVEFQFAPPPIVGFLLKFDPVLIGLILFSWMPIARLANTLVITIKRTEYIQAAQALGASPFRILTRHLIPNSIGPAIVLAARDVGSSVTLQATLTFINLGGTSPWGTMLSMGRNWIIGPGGSITTTWWVFLPATIAIIFFGIGWNLLGDGLTVMLNPSRASSEIRPKMMRLKKTEGRNRSLEGKIKNANKAYDDTGSLSKG